MKRNKRVYVLHYFLSIFIPGVIILFALIGLKITPFGDNTLAISDGNALYLSFLGYVGRAVKGQEGFFYSFEKALGGNMMDSWAWFLLNPFFALFSLFDVINYMSAYTLVSVVNLCFCGLTMYMLLKDIYGYKISNLIFSTTYALNGFLVANVFQMNFFLGVLILPIVLLGLRRILNNNKPFIYLFALSFSLLSNFYFGYMLCVASVIVFAVYYITNWSVIDNKRIAFANFISSSFIAGAISSVVWLPALLSLKGGRLDQSIVNAISFKENMPFLNIFSKLFIGANTTSELKNGLPNIFVGILPVFLVILFFNNSRIRKARKIAAAVLLCFYLLSFYIAVFNIAMHGGTVTNWFNYRDSFIFSFLMLMIAAEEFQYIIDEPKKNIRRAAAILIVSTLIVFSKSFDYVSGGMVLIDFFLLTVMYLAYRMHKKEPVKNTKRQLTIVVLLLVSVNLFLNYYFSVKNIMEWSHSESDYQAVVLPVGALIDAVKSSDSGFYRMEVGEQYSEVGNDPMLYGYNGVSHGGSDDRNFVRIAMSKLGVHRFGMRNYYGKGVTAATDALLGLRYIVSKEDLTEEKKYEKLVYIGEWGLYKNHNALPIALITNSNIANNINDIEDIFENLNSVWMAMTGIEKRIFIEEKNVIFTSHNMTDPHEISKKDAVDIVNSRDKAFSMNSNLSESLSNSSDSNVQLSENRVGTLITKPDQVNYIAFTWTADSDGAYYSYNRSGMTEDDGSPNRALNYEGYLHKGEKVTRYLPVNGGLVTEYLLEEVAGRFKIARADDAVLEEMSRILQNRESSIEKLSDNHLVGKFTIKNGQKLLFTIPYDRGWTCRVDGKKVKIEKALDLFMTVESTPGQHTFELSFIPTGLTLAVAILLISLALIPVYYWWIKKRIERRKKVLKKEDEWVADKKEEWQCFSKKDWLFASIVTLVVFLIGAGSLTSGVKEWGDDSFAYISEGIAIAENTFEEQAHINHRYHPTKIPKEAKDNKLVYVWGYPLIQSLVYRLVGFDYDTIVWYKIPALLSLSLTGGALVLFLRRRFPIYIASFTGFIFCLSGHFVDYLNNLYSDLPFLFLSILSLLLMECYFYRLSKSRNSVWLGVIYGVVLWMTYETRLSGYTVCVAAFLGHAVAFAWDERSSRKRIIFHVIPYVLLCMLVFFSEHIWLAPATSNLSDISGTTAVNNLILYCIMIGSYMSSLTGIPIIPLGAVLCILLVIGTIVAGLKRNIHLTIFMIGTLIVDILLPYFQGIRYLFNVLPIMVMYLVYGICFVGKMVLNNGKSDTGLEEKAEKRELSLGGRVIFCSMAIIILTLITYPRIVNVANNIANWDEKTELDVYSQEAREVYSYIQDHLSTDEVVAFAKPRALYLNTGRMSFRPNVNGHELSDANYYLKLKTGFPDFEEINIKNKEKEIVLENKMFILYKF